MNNGLIDGKNYFDPAVNFPIHLSNDCYITRLVERDASELFNVVNSCRAYLERWLPWVKTCLMEHDSLVFIQKAQEKLRNSESIILSLRCADKIIGIISILKLNFIELSAEIGYWISEEYQGRGIVTSACRHLIDHICFSNLGLSKIIITCDFGNEKSAAIPRRLGFTEKARERNADTAQFELVKMTCE